MCTYEVTTKSGKVLADGNLLSELIEHIVLLKIKTIERDTNVLTRLNKDLYKYLNQLSCFYNLSELHANLIENDWSYIENFLSIYNQRCYIGESEYISIQKEHEKEELTEGVI